MRFIFRPAGTMIALGLAALLLNGCARDMAVDCGALAVEDAWVRAAAPGAEVMGAYFVLTNTGDTAVTVNTIESAQFERAEMHETIVSDNGQASMQPLARVTVEPDDSVAFESGGKHVMLFSPGQTYKASDQVELILFCGERGAELPVAAMVRAQRPTGGLEQNGMPHDSHDGASG